MSSARTYKLAIVGFGKIARDQHLPALAANNSFTLAAIASPGVEDAPAPAFESLADLLLAVPDIDAVAVCTPPVARREVAELALRAGKHVLLEKPPAMTLAEATYLQTLAQEAGTTLFAAWHSRYAAGVEPARQWLAGRPISRIDIVWREDVRVWHPGQRWIWEPGGFGVFDPGINALSILTRLTQETVFVRGAHLHTPINCCTPLRADVQMSTVGGTPVAAHLDFLFEGPPDWRIDIHTPDGRLSLDRGGAGLKIDGVSQATSAAGEYDAVYADFAGLIEARRSEVDLTPLILTADAFAIAERSSLPPFEDA